MLPIDLWGEEYYFQYTEEETKAQRGEGIRPSPRE